MHIALIFLGALLIRLISLNQSLWLDEAVVAKVVKTIPLFQIPFQFSPGDFHPPLYYLFMSAWSTVFGTSEIALRMPSVLFSLIAGWYVYRIGTVVKNKTVGLWSAVFFLFNPLIIYYSQEARMYMTAVMLLSVALYHCLELIKAVKSQKSKIKSLVLFNLFSGLAFATFYGSIFFIVAMVAVGIWKGKWKLVVWGPLFVILLLIPLLLKQFDTAHVGLSSVKNWSLVLGKAELKNVFMVFIKFTSGRLSWFPKWSYYVVAGTWSLVVGVLLFMSAKKNTLFAFLFVFPLAIGLTVSFWAPMMQYFRFLYLIVPMSILLSLAVNKPKLPTWIPIYIGMTMIIFSFTYLLLPQFHREDWKQLTQHLQPRIPVYMILPSSDTVTFYRNDITLYELRDVGKAELPETIQVIPYVSEIYGFNYVKTLTEKGCVVEEKTSFRGPVIIERWKCLRNA